MIERNIYLNQLINEKKLLQAFVDVESLPLYLR